MCGPSSQEQNLSKSEAQFSNVLQSDYASRFGEQSAELSDLNNIFNSGIANPQGYTAPQLAAQNTEILDSTGANYANAAKALGGQLAGRGDSTLLSGVDQQIKGTLASQAAGQISAEQLQLANANANRQQENYWRNVSGAQSLANQYAPNAGVATQANSTAFGEADTIAQQQAQEEQAIAGGVASLALNVAVPGIGGALGGGGLTGALQGIANG